MFNIEEILRNADLIELAERAGAKFHKTGGEFRSHCPIHGGHDASAFAVSVKDGKQLWKCFSSSCGGGDVISFVMVWQGKSFKDACDFLGGNVLADPIEMERLARERLAKAQAEAEAAAAKEEARRKELQAEQKHLYYHQTMTDFFIQEWVKRGIGEEWQGFWNLGACPDFVISSGWHTPTLTIPIYDTSYEVLNIKHRLLNPQDPKDKYRPEKTGLGQFPAYITFPDVGYKGSITWVIEGEIKSMVTATITPDATWQFIGVPGKNSKNIYKSLAEKLFGQNVIVVPDPGAEKETVEFCKAVKGRWLPLNDKIDDLINAQGYDGDWLRAIEKQARRIR